MDVIKPFEAVVKKQNSMEDILKKAQAAAAAAGAGAGTVHGQRPPALQQPPGPATAQQCPQASQQQVMLQQGQQNIVTWGHKGHIHHSSCQSSKNKYTTQRVGKAFGLSGPLPHGVAACVACAVTLEAMGKKDKKHKKTDKGRALGPFSLCHILNVCFVCVLCQLNPLSCIWVVIIMVFGFEVNGNHEVEEFAYATRSWLAATCSPRVAAAAATTMQLK